VVISIHGQVGLVRSQMNNFHLFLHQQTDKQQISVLHDEQTVNGLRKIAWVSVLNGSIYI
jgi:hypothetical protein